MKKEFEDVKIDFIFLNTAAINESGEEVGEEEVFGNLDQNINKN